VRLVLISTMVSMSVALLVTWVFVVRPAARDSATISPADLVTKLETGVAKVGEPAPVVELTTFDGTTVSSSTFIGKPTVINFWASTCVPCVTEMPMIESVYNDLGDEVNFVGVDVFEAASLGAEMIERTGVTYLQTRDETHEVLGKFAGTAMPHTVVLDAEGRVTAMKSAALRDEAELRAMIDDAR